MKEIVAAGGYTNVILLGGGFLSPMGVAVDGSGNVFVADTGNNAVKEILAAGGYSNVIALGSGFSNPQGVAVDGSGNVFITDTGNSAVKEILAAGGYTSINPLGSGFSNPAGVAVDGSGNVVVTEPLNNAVKEIVAAGGYTNVILLGSGLSFSYGVAVDGGGNVFVADSGNNTVKKVMTQGVNFGPAAIATSTPLQIQLTFTVDAPGTFGTPAILTQGASGLDFADAGTGTCTAGATYNAADTCVLNVSFTPNFSGVRYGAATLSDNSGTVIATAHVYGTGAGPQVIFSPATQIPLGGGFGNPLSVAVDGRGNVFVADANVVKEIPVGCGNAGCVVLLARSFSFNNLPGIALDGSGNVFVADYGASKVYEILAAGGYTTVNTLGGGFSFSSPTGIAVDGSGNVFVADYNNNAVEEILAAGGYVTVNPLGGAFSAPQGVAADTTGNVYVADTSNNAVKEIPPGCANASFTVATGLTLSAGSGTGSSSGTATVAPGAAATFTIALAPGGSATYPDAVTFCALGLPAGASAIFSPATIPAGSGPTSVTLIIQTSSQTARNGKLFPGTPFAPVTMGFLMLPFIVLNTVRRRLKVIPRLTVALTVMVLSVGALLGLTGCGGDAPTPTGNSYTVVVTATDTATNAHSSINLTLNVQ